MWIVILKAASSRPFQTLAYALCAPEGPGPTETHSNKECNIQCIYLVLGQLNFTRLKVNANRPGCLQQFSCVGDPGMQLIKIVLELTQSQQCALQLVLFNQTFSK